MILCAVLPTAGLPCAGLPVADPGCQWVSVPGQYAWHTHTCPNCHTSWTHIAPIPMTARMNEFIHTCHKCGRLVYEFTWREGCGPMPGAGMLDAIPPPLLLAAGALAGLVLTAAFDRG
jgi:hypothetical protein